MTSLPLFPCPMSCGTIERHLPLSGYLCVLPYPFIRSISRIYTGFHCPEYPTGVRNCSAADHYLVGIRIKNATCLYDVYTTARCKALPFSAASNNIMNLDLYSKWMTAIHIAFLINIRLCLYLRLKQSPAVANPCLPHFDLKCMWTEALVAQANPTQNSEAPD